MALINWNTSYSVQNADMDKQHQRLFELLNQLHDAMGQGKGKETMPKIFDELVQYTRVHFAAEEALLQKYNYPAFAAHKALHEDLIAQLAKLQKQFQAGDLSTSMETRDFLMKWLADHIKGNDLKYGIFLKQKEAALK